MRKCCTDHWISYHIIYLSVEYWYWVNTMIEKATMNLIVSVYLFKHTKYVHS